MDSLKKKLEKRLHLRSHHHEARRKIVILPDEAGYSPRSTNVSLSTTETPTIRPQATITVPVGQLLDLSDPKDLLPLELTRRMSEDPTWSWTTNSAPDAASKLLLYLPFHVQSHLLGMLPMRDLLSVAQVNRSLCEVVKTERKLRENLLKMQLVWRKDFIRYMNQTYNAATQMFLTRNRVFGPVWDALFFQPNFLIVCYSPDIFEYEIRLHQVMSNDPFAPNNHNVFNPTNSDQDHIVVKEKPGTLLDNLMRRAIGNKNRTSSVNIWHLRLFTILKPNHCNPAETSSIWSSEDLTLLFFPKNCNISFTRGPIEYSDLMNFPMLERYYSNRNMLIPIIEILNQRYHPKFLLLSMKELPEDFQPVSYGFPIVVCDISPFKNYPEEFLCMTGETKIFQVVLEMNDSRSARDEKIRTLQQRCGIRNTGIAKQNISKRNNYQINDGKWTLVNAFLGLRLFRKRGRQIRNVMETNFPILQAAQKTDLPFDLLRSKADETVRGIVHDQELNKTKATAELRRIIKDMEMKIDLVARLAVARGPKLNETSGNKTSLN
ncbi:hypothetical protein BV898_03313 [Hypsibius exemplaris]|uniref:F-box domain-containing protein n=1 Tax=Hypsibius exemplaris TaxID=2072580 RepID=A0A1W0X6C8_HYPEX|nr:hypothetical protein BV898_03313 [Hypsibius exemplaris]